MFGADADVVSFLVKKYPGGAKKTDKDGLTALHLACDADGGTKLSVIERLVGAYPDACSRRDKRDGSTPLLLAVARNASVNVLKILIKANRGQLSTTDDRGRLPLHVAVAVRAGLGTFQLLVNEYPKGVSTKNKANETPIALAQRMKLDEDVIKLLQPSESHEKNAHPQRQRIDNV